MTTMPARMRTACLLPAPTSRRRHDAERGPRSREIGASAEKPQGHTCSVQSALFISVDGSAESYRRRPSELLLVADVLGRRLLDVRIAKLVRARDIELIPYSGGWTAAGEWGGWWPHLLNRHRAHRRWDALEPLTTTEDGSLVGRFGAGLARLKAAEIADLLENASAAETSDILGDLANTLETTIPIDWRRRSTGWSPRVPETHPTAPATDEAP